MQTNCVLYFKHGQRTLASLSNKLFLLLFFAIIYFAINDSRAASCGSITFAGKTRHLPCGNAQSKKPSAPLQSAAQYCKATLTIAGKTHVLNHRCTYKSAATVATSVGEPRGQFKSRQQQYKNIINKLSADHGVNVALIHAIISVESAYRADVVSKKGAIGLMQLMPATASQYAIANPFEPTQNVKGGIIHLKKLLAKYPQRLDLALAAYNAGAGSVAKYKNNIPPYRETQRYVVNVQHYLQKYQTDWQKYIE